MSLTLRPGAASDAFMPSVRVPTDLRGCEIAGLHTPLSGHCPLPRFSPNPQLPIIPTWHSEKSKRTGSLGSRARSVRAMSAAIRQPGLV